MDPDLKKPDPKDPADSEGQEKPEETKDPALSDPKTDLKTENKAEPASETKTEPAGENKTAALSFLHRIRIPFYCRMGRYASCAYEDGYRRREYLYSVFFNT